MGPHVLPQIYRRRVNRVNDHIKHPLTEPLPIDQLARPGHFTPIHFHGLFRSIIGEPLHAFFRRLRLEQAVFRMQHGPKATGRRVRTLLYRQHYVQSRFLTPFRFPRLPLVFFLSRIVRGVNVVDVKRPDAVNLDDGLSLGHGRMAHGLGHAHEGTGRHFLHLGRIEFRALADQKRALQDRDIFIARMPVGRDLIAIGKLGPVPTFDSQQRGEPERFLPFSFAGLFDTFRFATYLFSGS
jgi:AraC-like DNA-binding protein